MAIGDRFPEVLAAAQAGDHAAIETIYRDTVGLVVGYLRANGAREPEDVASEVYLSVLSGIARFAGSEQAFRSWLLTITHRRMVDGVRRAVRRREDLLPDERLVDHDPGGDDGEAEALARLSSAGILEAIDQLTPDQRAVLLLRALADLSIREIADIVDKPETAVKALLRRAVAALHRVLAARAGIEVPLEDDH